MQEESNFDILLRGTDLLSQHFWQQHQVVIVHPNQITILYVLSHGLREKAIDFLVCSPCRLVESDLTGVVMEEGPEDRICEACQRLSRDVWFPTYSKTHCNAVLIDHHQ